MTIDEFKEVKIGSDIWVDREYFINVRKNTPFKKEFDELLYYHDNRIPAKVSAFSGSMAKPCVNAAFKNLAGNAIMVLKEVPMEHLYLLNGYKSKDEASNTIYRTTQAKFSILDYGLIPVRIIYNNPATIVFWNDGTKTVVKKNAKEKYNSYNAFCAALAKKVYGTNSEVNRIVRSGYNQKMAEGQKKFAEFKKKVEKARKAKKGSKKGGQEK